MEDRSWWNHAERDDDTRRPARANQAKAYFG